MLKLLNLLIIYTIPIIPKFFIKIFATRYVAGISIQDALDTVKILNNKKLSVTLDILGEHTNNKEEATSIANDYVKILEQIKFSKSDCNISIKPSHIGTDINNEIFIKNLQIIHSTATNTNNFVRIDMEDSSLIDKSINAYNERFKIDSNIGIVLQAYLCRSENDLKNLQNHSNLRLCKGIYNESEKISIKDTISINKNYINLLKLAFKKNIYVGIASHDITLIQSCIKVIKEMGIPNKCFEFQILYGVPMDKTIQVLQNNNYKIRVYVPFGPDWYDYSIRRIKENPNIFLYIIKNLFKR